MSIIISFIAGVFVATLSLLFMMGANGRNDKK